MNARCWFLLLPLAGCGGAPFVADLGAGATGDDAPMASPPDVLGDAAILPDTAPSWPEASLGDAGALVSETAEAGPQTPDARPPDDARSELAMKGPPPPEDAGAADAPPESAACTPEGRGAARCEGSATFVTPESFCVGTYQGATPVGTATPTPPACQCAGAFTCACVLGALPDVCPPAATAHCQDSDAGPAVTCL